MADRDDKGRFVAGNKPKHVRQVGEANHISRSIRPMLRKYTKENFDEFVKKMNELNARDYCRLYIDMLKYVVHALQAIQLETDGEIDVKLETTIKHLADLASE